MLPSQKRSEKGVDAGEEEGTLLIIGKSTGFRVGLIWVSSLVLAYTGSLTSRTHL